MDNLRTRLSDCFTTVFPSLDADEVPRAAVSSVAGWDSIATINLVTVIEEEFGFQVPLGDVARLVSFEDILSYLRQQPCVAA